MSDAQLAKMEGWFKQLNKKIDQGLAKLSSKLDRKVDKDDFDLKFDRIWREFDSVKSDITRLSGRLENHQESAQLDLKLLKRQVLKIEDELSSRKS